MTLTAQTVREIALERPSSIRVFEKFGIDYCCGGRKPLVDACLEKGVAIDSVLDAMRAATELHSADSGDWDTAGLRKLSEHIVSVHHGYVRTELPRLAGLAQRVVVRHGSTKKELPIIQSVLAQLDRELTHHLSAEESVLFSYIAAMERALEDGVEKPASCFGALANPVVKMKRDHEAVDTLFAEIRRQSNDYLPPEGVCPTYHAFYDGLNEFEQDFHRHTNLENDILFPRAIAMDASMNSPD